MNYTDTPTTLQLGGVSKPSDSNFSETDRKVTWKNTSIKRIGQTIAARYGLGFTYDAEDYDIECDEQDGADSSYYNTLCQNYGLVLKVYARRLWVYDREAYKAKRAVRTFDRTDIIRGSLSWTTTLSGTYTGGTFDYTDADKDCDISCKVGGGTHIKSVNRRATSVQDAAVQLCAELNRANHGTIAALHRSGRLDRERGQHDQHYRLRRRSLRRRGRHQRQVFRGQGNAQIHQERRIYHGLRVQRRPGGLPPLRGGRLHPVQHGGVRHQRHELQQLLRDEHGGQRRQRGGGAEAGAAVTLTNAPFYYTSVAPNPSCYKSGVFYFYDGILVNGATASPTQPPAAGSCRWGQNVTGWVPASYCGVDTRTGGGGGTKATMEVK